MKNENQSLIRVLLDSASLKSLKGRQILNLKSNNLFEFISLNEPSNHTKATIVINEEKQQSEIRASGQFCRLK
ncbi:hypothetical protein AUJ46_02340 [Candidatus Peregrinibacteria bacterium CG1_02_54_53]|nr:MAG: hypothetical protein AUJ46_02340 [Candidatus Peregrinibacteria bacterium CG1_02_54_53]